VASDGVGEDLCDPSILLVGDIASHLVVVNAGRGRVLEYAQIAAHDISGTGCSRSNGHRRTALVDLDIARDGSSADLAHHGRPGCIEHGEVALYRGARADGERASVYLQAST